MTLLTAEKQSASAGAFRGGRRWAVRSARTRIVSRTRARRQDRASLPQRREHARGVVGRGLHPDVESPAARDAPCAARAWLRR